MKVINCENLILGRVCSRVAKTALLGQDVVLVNCEKLAISGNKSSILAHQRSMAERKGKPDKGVYYESRPDKFVRKVIRHMLPKNARGITAYHRIKCHISIPDGLRSVSYETYESDNVNKLPNVRYMNLAELCRLMGGKWYPDKPHTKQVTV